MRRHLIAAACALTAAVRVAGAQDISSVTPLAIGESFTIESKVLGETRRINVYRPPSWDEAEGAGGSAAFRDFFRDELMPAINARYRTTVETAIVGESLAGLFVVETLVVEPALFDTYIAFDPSLKAFRTLFKPAPEKKN